MSNESDRRSTAQPLQRPPAPPSGSAFPPADDAAPVPVELASPSLRLGCFLLERLLVAVTLGIGWLIWAAIVAGAGQTPAKQLLGLRVMRTDSGRPASLPWMLFMRCMVAGFVAGLALLLTVGVLTFMPFWDRRKQTVWDKVSGCVVIHDPDGRFANGVSAAALLTPGRT